MGLSAGCAGVAEVLHASWGRFGQVIKAVKKVVLGAPLLVQWLRSTLPRQAPGVGLWSGN